MGTRLIPETVRESGGTPAAEAVHSKKAGAVATAGAGAAALVRPLPPPHSAPQTPKTLRLPSKFRPTPRISHGPFRIVPGGGTGPIGGAGGRSAAQAGLRVVQGGEIAAGVRGTVGLARFGAGFLRFAGPVGAVLTVADLTYLAGMQLREWAEHPVVSQPCGAPLHKPRIAGPLTSTRPAAMLPPARSPIDPREVERFDAEQTELIRQYIEQSEQDRINRERKRQRRSPVTSDRLPVDPKLQLSATGNRRPVPAVVAQAGGGGGSSAAAGGKPESTDEASAATKKRVNADTLAFAHLIGKPLGPTQRPPIISIPFSGRPVPLQFGTLTIRGVTAARSIGHQLLISDNRRPTPVEREPENGHARVINLSELPLFINGTELPRGKTVVISGTTGATKISLGVPESVWALTAKILPPPSQRAEETPPEPTPVEKTLHRMDRRYAKVEALIADTWPTDEAAALRETLYQVLHRGKPLARIPRDHHLRRKVRSLMDDTVLAAARLFGAEAGAARNRFTGESIPTHDSNERYRFARHLLNHKAGRPIWGTPSATEQSRLQTVVGKMFDISVSDFGAAQHMLRRSLERGAPAALEFLATASSADRALITETYFGDEVHRPMPDLSTAMRVATLLGGRGSYREVGVTLAVDRDGFRPALSLGSPEYVASEGNGVYFLLHTHPETYSPTSYTAERAREEKLQTVDHVKTIDFNAARLRVSRRSHNTTFSQQDVRLFMAEARRYFGEHGSATAGTPLYNPSTRTFNNWVLHPYGGSQIAITLNQHGQVEHVAIHHAINPTAASIDVGYEHQLGALRTLVKNEYGLELVTKEIPFAQFQASLPR